MRGEAIVISGLGAVSPLGDSQGLWQRLLRGESAVHPWPELAGAGFRCTHAARVEGHAAEPHAALPPHWLPRLAAEPLRRGRTLALLAAEAAWQQATGLQPEEPAPVPTQADVGVYLGSTLGESLAFERAAEGEPLHLADHGVASFTAALRRHWRLRGPHASLATACAAGNYAVGAAMDALRAGRVRMAIAGGVEPFSRISLVGFSRSRAMASERCRPFDAERSGMVLGEGAAMFVLERADHALARGARPLAEVRALGLSCDAHHPTAPLADGSGMAQAMQAALQTAGIPPDQVGWVNAHGTGTRASDAAEARALHSLFGARLPAVSGSKGALGHALGAASALELAICVHGLKEQLIPPTPGHREPDPDGGIACTTTPLATPLPWVLNNAFAFAGLNSALLLRAWEGP